jgi:hypothetical protein
MINAPPIEDLAAVAHFLQIGGIELLAF